MAQDKDITDLPAHFQPVKDRREWIVEHKTPNRTERRKFLKNSRKAAKKAKREDKYLGQ
jgi:hypothetical protein